MLFTQIIHLNNTDSIMQTILKISIIFNANQTMSECDASAGFLTFYDFVSWLTSCHDMPSHVTLFSALTLGLSPHYT